MGQQFGTSKIEDISVLTYIHYAFPPPCSYSVIVSNEHNNGGALIDKSQLWLHFKTFFFLYRKDVSVGME